MPVEENEGKKPDAKVETEFEEFLEDIAEDPEYRSGIVLYKAPNAEATAAAQAAAKDAMEDEGDEDEDYPDVGIDELVEEVAAMAVEGEDDEDEDGDEEIDDGDEEDE